MIKNVGKTDKMIRTLLAIVLLGLIFFGGFGIVVNIVLGIITLVLVATSMSGTCPAYMAAKISTNKADEAA
jgi:K+-transporting ATPase A subunit